jgi:hypothetical protein
MVILFQIGLFIEMKKHKYFSKEDLCIRSRRI